MGAATLVVVEAVYSSYLLGGDIVSCKTKCMLCYFHFESRVVKIEALQ